MLLLIYFSLVTFDFLRFLLGMTRHFLRNENKKKFSQETGFHVRIHRDTIFSSKNTKELTNYSSHYVYEKMI